MSGGMNIEIIGNYKERYAAKIHSFTGENELTVKFDDNPEFLCKVPINNVLLCSEITNKVSDFKEGSNVLVLQTVDDCNSSIAQFNNPRLSKAWWPAKINLIKGDFAAILYANKDSGNSNEIVELTKLRPLNDSRPLLQSDIRFHDMMIPDDLCEFCEHYDVCADLERWCGPTIVVTLDKPNKRLQIFSIDQEVIRKACLLEDAFIKVLRQKKRVYSQTDELTKRLKDTVKNHYTEEFTVDQEFIGLAIGAQGNNIKKARELDGILSIDLNDKTHTFVISAQTQEAAKTARAQLEYMKKVYYVPMDIVSKVIGKNGNQIHDIIDQSGIMRVRVVEGPDRNQWSDDENMLEDHVPFVFVGSANSIRDACLLLEFSIEYHRDIEKLQKERDAIDREVRNSQSNIARKNFSYSASDRENDHFKNDSVRGYNNRGRPRGRNNYRNISNSDVEQRNDSFNDDPMMSQQKYRGNGRMAPHRRGMSNFRQGSLPPMVNGQHNGSNRRYPQYYDEDTDDYNSATNESECTAQSYRGQRHPPSSRGGGGGPRGARPYYNNNYAPTKHTKQPLSPPPVAPQQDVDHRRRNGGGASVAEDDVGGEC